MKETFTIRDKDGLHKYDYIESTKEGVSFELIVYDEIINENWCISEQKVCKHVSGEDICCNYCERNGIHYMDCKYYSKNKMK